MRFGLNTFLFTPGFTDADLPLIARCQSYGAQVIELAIVEPSAVNIARLDAALRASGLEQPVICGAFGPGRDLRGTPEQAQATTRYITELIDLAAAVGAKVVCGPMYSETGRSSAHTPAERESQLQQIADRLRPLCVQAEAAGVTLAIEPLNRFETDCINTLEQAAALIARVGSPRLKIHIDTFHMNIEEADSGAAIRRHGQHIAHVHASASHRGMLGQDQVDWPGVLAALHDIDYQGAIVIESFSDEIPALARATSIWRKLYDSPQAMAIEGLKFLESQWLRQALAAAHPLH